MLLRLIPKNFYDDLEQGLDLFESCLGYHVLHRDGDLAIVERDGAEAYIVTSPDFAAKDRPEFPFEMRIRDAFFVDIAVSWITKSAASATACYL